MATCLSNYFPAGRKAEIPRWFPAPAPRFRYRGGRRANMQQLKLRIPKGSLEAATIELFAHAG